MFSIEDMSISRKLTLIVITVCGVALMLSAAAVLTVFLQSDTGDLRAGMEKCAGIVGLIAISIGMLAYVLNARLQRSVIDPIMSLVQTVNAISTKKDYSIRADRHGNDELSALMARFNEMLKEIQNKDAALQRARDELEERVVQRTAELEQEVTTRKHVETEQQKLLQKLESANQELSDFAHVVSHDLKAPVRAIGSLAGWLASDYGDKFDKDGKEKLDLLVGRTNRMHELIGGILEYSRIGHVKEEAVTTNLNELIKDVLDIIAPPENIQIMVQKDLPTVQYDRTRMVQVFQNLIGNAVKYMDKPKGIVKVIYADEGSYWQFTIRDNGAGIHWKYFDKIFQLFQTLAQRDKPESTGVGLALVKKIVTTWGGKIWVESEVGVGSSFIFTLPKT